MYYTTGISYLGSYPTVLGRVVRARTVHADKVVQAYVAGRLAAWTVPHAGEVEFALPALGGDQRVILLAVDPAQAEVNYWQEVAGVASASRIRVRMPQTLAPYRNDDRWGVYLGQAGQGQASCLVHSQPVYDDGGRAGGFGAAWGSGGFGWDAPESYGLGLHFGYGEFGFDCDMLVWVSPPLPRGQYPLRTIVEDACGNVLAEWESTVNLASPPQPPSDLTVESYDAQSDTLTLSFTPSGDL